jgi:transposase-like protein
VQKVVSERVPPTTIADEYGVDSQDVKSWVKKAHHDNIAQLVAINKRGPAEVAEAYGIDIQDVRPCVKDVYRKDIARRVVSEKQPVASVAQQYGLEEPEVEACIRDYRKEMALKVITGHYTSAQVADAYGVTELEVSNQVAIAYGTAGISDGQARLANANARRPEKAYASVLDAARAKYGAAVDADQRWAAMYGQKIAEDVIKNHFTREAVAAAYGLEVSQVDQCVAAYHPPAADAGRQSPFAA